MGEKIAFSGSHGTGKSTSVGQAFIDNKMAHPEYTIGMIMENAKDCPFDINKGGNIYTQYWIFCNQVQRELYLQDKYDLVICDRSVVDSIAYGSVVLGNIQFTDSLIYLASQYVHTYKEIIFRSIKTNDYWYDDNFRQANDQKFRQDVEDELLRIYDEISTKYDCKVNLRIT